MLDFSPVEYEQRLLRVQAAMDTQNLDAIFLSSEPEIRYFSGFRTPFWLSPTRPWFLIIPGAGKPIAIIPTIGEELMSRCYVAQIHTWASPNPQDEGISLLSDILNSYSRIGMLMGTETSLRLPLKDFYKLKAAVPAEIIDCTAIIKNMRMAKSEAEIGLIRTACEKASSAFDNLGSIFVKGQTLEALFRSFKIELLNQGMDDVPYLVGGAGKGGYRDVISPPGPQPLETGDVLMLDTGSQYRGYFCDFDRNFGIGNVETIVSETYEKLWDATESGLKTARAGVSCSQLFNVMYNKMHPADANTAPPNIGRYGHGLGMQLTEWPSIAANDSTILKAGMVMTLEPSMEYGNGKMMVHEENILITDGEPVLLSKRAPPQIPII